MKTGTVRWFSYSKGCGYIMPDEGGADVYAHSAGLGCACARSLKAEQRVTYDVRLGPNGALASDVAVLF